MEHKYTEYADYLEAIKIMALQDVSANGEFYTVHGLSPMQGDFPIVQRQYKDTVFRMLFHENFVFAFELNLYEHQSTVNPNLPLRDLFYVAHQLQKLVADRKLYRSKPVQIPSPRFVAFYNGNTKMPERTEYRLSDLYKKPLERPELELTVTVYNINPGMNQDLLEACRLLKEYMLFTAMIRENRQKMTLQEAIHKAVDDCIRENILADFLREQRAEVIATSLFEYDHEAHMEVVKEEGWEEGFSRGHTEGFNQGHNQGHTEALLAVYETLIAQGYSREKALSITGLTAEQLSTHKQDSSAVVGK